MNDPSVIPPTDEEAPVTGSPHSSPLSQIEGLIRRHPVAAAMATVGFGVAVGIVAREFLAPPPSPKHRAVQLLEDIQHRLAELAEPAYDRASHLADDGIDAVKRGVHSISSSRLGSRLCHLFS
ncbi:hypothetical protein [Prosthecobacter sp.]|uniref:hypothetical protein n=1 Tax=Prosthecobacter sp. TaxID=1965333 RepID=UPI0037843700